MSGQFEIVGLDRRTIYASFDLALTAAKNAQQGYNGVCAYTFGVFATGAAYAVYATGAEKEYVGWLFDGAYMREDDNGDALPRP
jgi:hypothetical protein